MSTLPAVNPTELAQSLVNAQQRVASTDGAQFMKFAKDGTWVFGADDLEVEDGPLWAIHPGAFMEGFIAWHDNEVVGEEMRSMTGGDPVMLSELPRVDGQGWQKQVSLLMVCLSGDDEGTQVIYKTSSKGGRKEVARLISEVVKQLGDNPKEYVPVVKLESDSYKHKKYGKIYTPVLDISDWMSFDAETFEAEEKAEGERGEDADDTPEPEQEEEKPAPKRRRRRTS